MVNQPKKADGFSTAMKTSLPKNREHSEADQIHGTLNSDRIKAVCFDIDGTLCDTDDQFVENIVHMFAPLKPLLPNWNPYPLARQIVMATETPGSYLFGLPDLLGVDGQLAKIGSRLHDLGLGKSPAPYKIIPGALAMLEALHRHYPLALVSARSERNVTRFLDQFHLEPLFQVIVSAQTTRRGKPQPDPLLFAAEKLDLSPDCMVMVGDTTADIKAAVRAGCQSIGVTCGFGTKHELLRQGADLLLSDTPLVMDYLLPAGAHIKKSAGSAPAEGGEG